MIVHTRISRPVALAAMALAFSATAGAQGLAGFADPAAIDGEVARFTGTPTGQEGGALLPVDRRLRLAACRSPLALSWRQPRRDSVVVECPDIGGWRLFVPVRTSLPTAAQMPVVARGEVVTVAVTGEGFSVSQSGEALDSGAQGAWIRVRALTADKASAPVRARIERPGLVAVPLP